MEAWHISTLRTLDAFLHCAYMDGVAAETTISMASPNAIACAYSHACNASAFGVGIELKRTPDHHLKAFHARELVGVILHAIGIAWQPDWQSQRTGGRRHHVCRPRNMQLTRTQWRRSRYH